MGFRSDASETAQFSVLVVIFLVIVVGGVGLLSAARLGFLPWFVETERRIFEESRSHVDGTNKQISRLGVQVQQLPDNAQRAAIVSQLCIEAAQIDRNDLSERNLGYVRSHCPGL